jgi:hypothetical protein
METSNALATKLDVNILLIKHAQQFFILLITKLLGIQNSCNFLFQNLFK